MTSRLKEPLPFRWSN